MSLENTRIKDIAAQNPLSISIFERHGIDFCCNGQRTLAEACRLSGSDAAEVIGELVDASSRGEEVQERNWNQEALSVLIQHILDQHHQYLRRELPRLEKLAAKVALVHGERHPELSHLQDHLLKLREELMDHMQKEEAVLFPHIRAIEAAARSGGEIPSTPFGTVNNPIRIMEHEHELAGELLRRLRHTTSGYEPPADGCNSVTALYQGLADLEQDLHRHIHLENNILFPRSMALEVETHQYGPREVRR